MKVSKNKIEISLEENRIYLLSGNGFLKVEITPVWEFFKKLIIHEWTVEEFIKEKELETKKP